MRFIGQNSHTSHRCWFTLKDYTHTCGKGRVSHVWGCTSLLKRKGVQELASPGKGNTYKLSYYLTITYWSGNFIGHFCNKICLEEGEHKRSCRFTAVLYVYAVDMACDVVIHIEARDPCTTSQCLMGERRGCFDKTKQKSDSKGSYVQVISICV